MYTVCYVTSAHPPAVRWLKFAAELDRVCLRFLDFAEQPLKQLLNFSLCSCETVMHHLHALTLPNKCEIVSF
jgi:hypothetical protein